MAGELVKGFQGQGPAAGGIEERVLDELAAVVIETGEDRFRELMEVQTHDVPFRVGSRLGKFSGAPTSIRVWRTRPRAQRKNVQVIGFDACVSAIRMKIASPTRPTSALIRSGVL